MPSVPGQAASRLMKNLCSAHHQDALEAATDACCPVSVTVLGETCAPSASVLTLDDAPLGGAHEGPESLSEAAIPDDDSSRALATDGIECSGF